MDAAPRSAAVRGYVDGFNLYFGALRFHPELKWLDLVALCERLAPQHATVDHVHYCTARVGEVADDRAAPERQDTYLRALAASPRVTIHEGSFRIRVKPVYVADRQPIVDRHGRREIARPHEHPDRHVPSGELGLPSSVWAKVTEEKGTDVNLAVSLIHDATEKRVGTALLFTDDADLVPAVELARRHGVRVIVVSPGDRWMERLTPDHDDARTLPHGLLAECQLPDEVRCADGTIARRPHAWR